MEWPKVPNWIFRVVHPLGWGAAAIIWVGLCSAQEEHEALEPESVDELAAAEAAASSWLLVELGHTSSSAFVPIWPPRQGRLVPCRAKYFRAVPL